MSDLEVIRLQFEKFVGKTIGMNAKEFVGERNVGGKRVESRILDTQLNHNDPVVQEIDALGEEHDIQVIFESVATAGVGGPTITVSTEPTEANPSYHVITGITAEYC